MLSLKNHFIFSQQAANVSIINIKMDPVLNLTTDTGAEYHLGWTTYSTEKMAVKKRDVSGIVAKKN